MNLRQGLCHTSPDHTVYRATLVCNQPSNYEKGELGNRKHFFTDHGVLE